MFALIRKIYRERIAGRKREVTFWILTTFLVTFILARALVILFPELFIKIRGTHIHHFAWGILLLGIAGYLALTDDHPRFRSKIAALYGIGLALAFDEFGMWIHLEDAYWMRQSYDAMIIILLWLMNAVSFGDVWKRFFLGTVRLLLRSARASMKHGKKVEFEEVIVGATDIS